MVCEPASAPASRALLVVEDEPLIRLATADYLRACGHDVIEFGSADDAIVFLQTGADVELVFSDVQLPGHANGIALHDWLRIHRADVPIVLTSGDERWATRTKDICRDAPFFAKPYRLEAVAAMVRTLIDGAG